jgi:nitrilase
MKEICVAAVQMASGPNVSANLLEAGRLIANAAKAGAKLIVLPEYFSIMGMQDTDKLNVAEPIGQGVIQQFLAQQAKKHGVWLVGGTIPITSETPGKVKNTCLVFDASGKQVARYDKIHLFGLSSDKEQYNEASTISAGNEVVVVETPWGKMGIGVCYDLRFPELFRAMLPMDFLVLPAAFTATTGKAHWEVLLRARAIENQVYLIASAQGGFHVNGRETHGDSMIIDPWGEILDRLPRGSGFVLGHLSQQHLQRVRKKLPALQHIVKDKL